MRHIFLPLIALLATTPALAHPHVWVVTRAEVVFDEGGRITAVRHVWTFDEMTSSTWLEGRSPANPPPPEKLAEIASGMKEAMVHYEYYTSLKANGAKPAFAEWRGERMTFADGRATLHFELPLKEPAPANRYVVLTVSDPTFFVDFRTAEDEDAIKLAGAPKGCALTVARPKNRAASGESLGESLFQSLKDASSFAGQFASRATVACP